MNKRKLSNILSWIWLLANVTPLPFGGTLAMGFTAAIFGLRRDSQVFLYSLCLSVLILALVILFCQEKNSEGKRVRFSFPIFTAAAVVLIYGFVFLSYLS